MQHSPNNDHLSEQRTRERWSLPLIVLWIGVLIGWYFLVYHFCRNTFNPHAFNPRIHQIVTREGKIITDVASVSDDEGYVEASKWRDPVTKNVYTPAHPDVLRGNRLEKLSRAFVTFLCGLPLLCGYRIRARELGRSKSELRELAAAGLALCFIAGAISYFIPVVELVLALACSPRYGE